jgi:hypothetical protein
VGVFDGRKKFYNGEIDLAGEAVNPEGRKRGLVRHVIQFVINDVAETETKEMAHGSDDSEKGRQYRSVWFCIQLGN